MSTVIKEPSVVWYKDRDFPEVKSSNSDIVAVIEDPKQLERVIEEHNDLLGQLEACFADIKALTRLFDQNKRLYNHLSIALKALNDIDTNLNQDCDYGGNCQAGQIGIIVSETLKELERKS